MSSDTSVAPSASNCAEQTSNDELNHETAVTEDCATEENFPLDSKNPFSTPSCGSDLVLVVEDKKLHVHKTVLSLHSPVFRTMFTANFAEKDAKEIKLPGKKYDAMLQFLLQMYPVHSTSDLKDDDVLVKLLSLAEEYQSQHVRVKCEAYIGLQIRVTGGKPFAGRKMLYLLMCDRFRLTKHFDTLLNMASNLRMGNIQKSPVFSKLLSSTQTDLVQRRCRVVEGLLNVMQNKFRRISAYKKCAECHEEKDFYICSGCLKNVAAELQLGNVS